MLNRIKNNTKAKTAALAGSLLLLLALASTTFLPAPAHALECAAVETSVIECESGTAGGEQTSGIWSLLLIVLNVLTAGVGVMAVGGFIYAAILWTTAEDKADQLNQAKGVILNTCIGLISFGLMYSLLQFLVPGGVFNSIAAPKVSVDKQRDVNPGMEDNGTSSGGGSGGSGQSGGGAANESGPRVDMTATYSFQNLGREEASSTAVFQDIKSGLGDRANVVYNFAEIDEGDDGEHTALKSVFGKDGWSNFSSRVPSLNRLDSTKWKSAGNETIKLHGGTGGNSGPERVLTISKFQGVQSGSTKLAVLNTHFVANAYNGGMKPELQEFWDTAWTKLKTKVTELNKNKYDIVITADFNRQSGLPKLHNDTKELIRIGPDRILAIPAAGRKITGLTTGNIITPTGEGAHNGCRWAKLTFTGQ